MSHAEELLEQIDISDHEHSVSDTDKTFTVDPFTRKIIADSGQKTILIQGDHKSEVFTFTIPRYIEGHDMAACNKIYIPYINTEVGKNPEFKSGVYTVSDITVNEDTIVLKWELSINATSIEGSLQFMILLSCMEGSRVEYRWNTDYFEDVIVKKSLYSNVEFEAEFLDVIEQWKVTVKQVFKEYIDSHIDIIKEDVTEGLITSSRYYCPSHMIGDNNPQISLNGVDYIILGEEDSNKDFDVTDADKQIMSESKGKLVLKDEEKDHDFALFLSDGNWF